MGTIDFTDSIYDAQQGSQSSIKFIYDNTIQFFCKEAGVLMRDEAEAASSIKDAYLFIFTHLDTLEDTSRFLLWANEVCKNTCISRLKKAKAFNDYIPAEAANLGEVLPASDFDPMINIHARMLPEHIKVCLDSILDSLPDSQRICAVLWGEGYPVHSIARKLSLSIVSVNYILACTLGGITNAVSTLSDNGLPLHSMEPIPFFLWLLMSYYQNCEAEEPSNGSEASFLSILQVLLPDEAPMFMADFNAARENEGRPGAVNEEDILFAEDEMRSSDSGAAAPGYDAPLYSSAGQDGESASGEGKEDIDPDSYIKDSPQSGTPDADKETDSEVSVSVPPMEIYTADGKGETGSEDGEASPSDGSSGSEPEKSHVQDSFQSSDDLEQILAGIRTGEDAPEEPEKKKGHGGLIIALIIIFLVLVAAALGYLRHSSVVAVTVNGWIGKDIVPVVHVEAIDNLDHIFEGIFKGSSIQETTEPETEAPTTAAPVTEPETTTPAPTEPETTTAAPEPEGYYVRIYPEWEGSLNMHVSPAQEAEVPGEVPYLEEVLVTDENEGWGYINYNGIEGWIWLGNTQPVE
ncbi:MAG: SH3 domain-containing protein [Parasporobacterium sp.]|nr:SH3 domain-containing protein [Parasporobacterium sp.]